MFMLWSQGDRWYLPAPFSPYRSPLVNPVPRGHSLRLVNNSSSYMSQVFFSNCCFYTVSPQVVCHAVTLRVETQLPVNTPTSACPKLNMLIFKIPVFFFIFFFNFFFSTFIYFWDRERQSMNGGGAEREGDTESETGSRLRAISPEPDAGLELPGREIVTWLKSDA